MLSSFGEFRLPRGALEWGDSEVLVLGNGGNGGEISRPRTNKTRAIFTAVTAYEAIQIRNKHPSPTGTEASGAHPPVASV